MSYQKTLLLLWPDNVENVKRKWSQMNNYKHKHFLMTKPSSCHEGRALYSVGQ